MKGNQPKLYQQLNHQFERASSMDTDIQTDYSHGRQVERRIDVLTPMDGIDPNWVGVQRIIRVERTGIREGKPFAERVFYISSKSETARQFAERVRAHWQVENRLHWVKDVVMKEDEAPLCGGCALINFSILRTIAIDIFRKEGFTSITKGIRALAHDIDRLFFFLQ